MMNYDSRPHCPRLLVSVRSASEASRALAGGADVVDIKEPNRGALGAADPATIVEIVRLVSGRAPITTACGELREFGCTATAVPAAPIPEGVALFKIGLAGCRENLNWQSQWRETSDLLQGGRRRGRPRPVAVVYADWHAANAPAPGDVLRAAVDVGSPALLIDTWDKSVGTLFDSWPAEGLLPFIRTVRSSGMAIVLAGSLAGDDVGEAARLGPDLIAVRAAACEAGRHGTVTGERVHELKRAILAAAKVAAPSSDPRPDVTPSIAMAKKFP